LPVRLEIPRRRLLDIENPPEARGRTGADPAETLEHVLNVWTALVEIQAIRKIGDTPLGLHGRGDPIDCQRPFDVPRQIVALQLDLDAHETVAPNPFGQCLGQAVANRMLDVPRLERIEPADAVKERDSLPSLRQQCSVEPYAAKPGTEITRRVVRHEIRAVGVVDVAAVNFSEG